MLRVTRGEKVGSFAGARFWFLGIGGLEEDEGVGRHATHVRCTCGLGLTAIERSIWGAGSSAASRSESIDT